MTTKHKLTDEQNAVIHAKDALVIKVIAYAGTGKTFILDEFARARPRQKILYVAYNSALQREAKSKFPKNTQCRTMHSLAYHQVGSMYAFKLEDPKQNKRLSPVLVADFLRLTNYKSLSKTHLGSLVLDTVQQFLYSDKTAIGPEHVPELAGKDRELRQHLLMYARQQWRAMQDLQSPMLMSHDGYLKLWALSKPRLDYDNILFDEGQDANAVMAMVIGQQAANRVYVGDSHQQIYAWRGAVDALQSLEGDTYRLTRSFRFGQPIALAANRVLTHLGETVPLVGTDKPAVVQPLPPGARADVVLCRTNSTIFQHAVDALDRYRFYVVGDIDQVCSRVESAYALYAKQPVRDYDIRLYQDWEEFCEAGDVDPEVALLTRLVKEYGHDIPYLARRLRQEKVEVKDEASADLVLTTAHRAKGRQWPKVQLANDFERFLIRKPSAKQLEDGDDGRPKPDELRLFYVALTRGQDAVYVSEPLLDAYPPLAPGEAMTPTPTMPAVIQAPGADSGGAQACETPATPSEPKQEAAERSGITGEIGHLLLLWEEIKSFRANFDAGLYRKCIIGLYESCRHAARLRVMADTDRVQYPNADQKVSHVIAALGDDAREAPHVIVNLAADAKTAAATDAWHGFTRERVLEALGEVRSILQPVLAAYRNEVANTIRSMELGKSFDALAFDQLLTDPTEEAQAHAAVAGEKAPRRAQRAARA